MGRGNSLEFRNFVNEMNHHDLLKKVKEDIYNRVEEKFWKGAESHKGDIFDVNLDKELEEELIDALVYLTAKRMKNENKTL